MELPDSSGSVDALQLQHDFEALAEEHVRTHPHAVQVRFWLRRFLEDVPPGDRALAVKEIYSELRVLWGDQDSRGVYTIDEALGTPTLYRLWLAANRCSYPACRHAADSPPDRESRLTGTGSVAWHRELLGRILPPPQWNGTSREWRELSNSVIRNCTCSSGSARSANCSAHQLLEDGGSFNRLLFGRRMASRLHREEFSSSSVTFAGAPDRAHAA